MSSIDITVPAGSDQPARTGSGRLSLFGLGLRDATLLAWALVTEFRFAFVGALGVGTGIALFAPGAHQSTVALIAATTCTYAIAMALGVRALRDTAHRSMYYSQPISAASIWWGTLFGGLGSATALGACVLIPAALITKGQAVDIDSLPLIAGGIPAAFLLPNILLSLGEAHTRWRFFNIVPLAITFAGFYSAYRLIVPTVLPGNGPRAAFMIFVCSLHAGALLAAHLRASKARLDSRRGHHAFAIALWALLLIGAGLTIWTARAVSLPDPTTIRTEHIELSTQGPWVAINAWDDGAGVLAWLRDKQNYWFAVNEDTAEWQRLTRVRGVSRSQVSGRAFNATAFAAEANAMFWMQYHTGAYGSLGALQKLDLTTGTATAFPYPDTDSVNFRWWVDTTGKFAIMVGEQWSKEGDEAFGVSSLTVEIVELFSGRSIAKKRVKQNPEGPLHASLLWGDDVVSSTADLEWANSSEGIVTIVGQFGPFSRMAIDLDTGAISELTRIHLDPSFAAAPQPATPVIAANGSFRRPTWNNSTDELWLAMGEHLYAYSNAVSADIQEPSRTVLSAPSDSRISDYQQHSDRLITIENKEQNMFFSIHRQLPSGEWLTESRAPLEWQGLPRTRLGEGSYALLEHLARWQDNPVARVLHFEDGIPKVVAARQWLEDAGLPSSSTINVGLSGELYQLDDGSLWRTDRQTMQPKRFSLPLQIGPRAWRHWANTPKKNNRDS